MNEENEEANCGVETCYRISQNTNMQESRKCNLH
jgi:hypothetical protein